MVSRSYLLARLGSIKLFWRIRHRFDWLNFRRLRTGFQTKDKLNAATIEIQYWWAMIKSVAFSIVLALAASFAMYLFDKHCLSFFTNMTWIRDSKVGTYLLYPLDGNAYVQMLATIAGIAGVFLGLYFTAVSTVISNTYSYVSGDIRELILKDRLGNIYVRLVAFLTALAVVLLSFSAAKVSPPRLAVPLLAVLSCLAIFVFVKLGSRAFFLSDPTLLFSTLANELQKWVNQATYRGYQWRNPSFQEYYRKQALKSANTLTVLIEISSSKTELHSKSYPLLLTKLLILASTYYGKKHLIPTDSRWYGKKPKHKQWYLTNSAIIEIATQTNTTLQPDEIPDTTWLEDIILSAVLKALKADADPGDYRSLYNKISSLPKLFDGMGKNWFVKDGKKRHDKLSKDILAMLISSQAIDEAQEIYSIAVIDILASLPISLELSFIKTINGLNVDKLRSKLINTKWSRSNAPYQFSLPSNAIRVLEQANDSILFERQARVQHGTPNWYIIELVFHELELAIYDQWQLLMGLIETWYVETGKLLSDAKRYKQSANIYNRAIELAWKLDSHIEDIKELSKALRKDAKIDFLKQVEWNWDIEHKRIANFRNMVIKGQAELIPQLFSTKELDPDMPDFFGGAVHRTGEACYEALEAGDAARFKVLFRPYFLGVLGIFDSIRLQVKDWETSSAITWMAEPLLDLFNISGYAYIYTEFHNKPELWNECKVVWDAYLADTPQQLQLFAAISNYHQLHNVTITSRTTLRSKWQRRLADLLNNLPRQGGLSAFYSQSLVQHQSELIRRIAPWNTNTPFMLVDAIDIFTVSYLMIVTTDTALDFGVEQDKIDVVNGRQEDKNA